MPVPGGSLLVDLWATKTDTEKAPMQQQPMQITEHVYSVDALASSVYLLVDPEGVTLVDAGFPGTMALVAAALDSLGRGPGDLRNVLVTHCHPDHAGGLAEMEKATNARAWMHPADAAMVRTGRGFRPWKLAPGFGNRLFARRVIKRSPQTCEPAEVHNEVRDGETIPIAGGILAVGTPGHTLGHLAFHWPGDGGVLFAGDAANNVHGLALSPIYEDLAVGKTSLRKLAQLEFETVCFAHGAPIVGGAARAFSQVWGS